MNFIIQCSTREFQLVCSWLPKFSPISFKAVDLDILDDPLEVSSLSSVIWTGLRDRLFAQNKKENLFYAFQVHWVPSGNLTVCYWKWPSRNSWFSHWTWWIFPSFFVNFYLRPGTFSLGRKCWERSPWIQRFMFFPMISKCLAFRTMTGDCKKTTWIFQGMARNPGDFWESPRDFPRFPWDFWTQLRPPRQGFMYILQQEKEERIRREQEELEGPSLTVDFLILSLGQALTGSFSLILESFDTNEVLYQTDKQVFKAGKGVCRVFFSFNHRCWESTEYVWGNVLGASQTQTPLESPKIHPTLGEHMATRTGGKLSFHSFSLFRKHLDPTEFHSCNAGIVNGQSSKRLTDAAMSFRVPAIPYHDVICPYI